MPVRQTVTVDAQMTTGIYFAGANPTGERYRVDPGEYNPTPKSVFTPDENRIDPNLKDPRTDEILLSYQREVASNVSFGVNWIQRWFNDLLSLRADKRFSIGDRRRFSIIAEIHNVLNSQAGQSS